MLSQPTLQLYLARRFLTGILGTFLLCSVLIFMIDFVEMLRQSGKYGAVPAWKLGWITLLRLPAYTELLLSFAVLVGSIAAFLMLARKSELAVMRSGGMSVWQFLRPGLIVAFALGVFAVVAYNPLAAYSRGVAEKLTAEAFGRENNALRLRNSGSWLRQDGIDGESIINAGHVSKRGSILTGVSAFVFDRQGHFLERLDSPQAELKEGYWLLRDAVVSRVGHEPEKFSVYLLSTYLTPERVADALGSVISLSIWELPGLIEVAEKAKLSSAAFRVQFALLLCRPLLCVAMVLLAATVSLRSFRSGGIQTMVVTGMVGGFSFFLLAEVSRQLGVAGIAPPWAAVWLPVLLAILATTTVLLHQEDG
ncbi:MAG: LPS export ABC transporter permease LptG [Hyphomicrobium sp.]